MQPNGTGFPLMSPNPGYAQQLQLWQPNNFAAAAGGTPAPSPASVTDPNFLQQAFGYTDQNGAQPGFVAPALQTFTGLASMYLGMKQYGLAKDAFKESKRQFNLNFDANRKTTNARLEDRQRARVASNPGAYQSVGAYMQQNGI